MALTVYSKTMLMFNTIFYYLKHDYLAFFAATSILDLLEESDIIFRSIMHIHA